MAEPSPREKLLRQFARDFSTMTAEELRAKYRAIPRDVAAFNHIEQMEAEAANRRPVTFEERLLTHNPIYYLAERVFFDNTLVMPSEVEAPTLLHKSRTREKFLYPPLHRDILCKELVDYTLSTQEEDELCLNLALIVLIQRDCFKTTFTHGVYPLWLALRHKHLFGENVRILLVHYKEMQASAAAQLLKDKARFHPWLREVWPEFCSDDDFGTKTEFDWPCVGPRVVRERSVFATGITGDVTGWHFDYIIFDDLVTKEHIKSRVIREDVALRHDALLYTLDTTGGKRVYSGTRYHVQDLYGRMLKATTDGKPLYRSIVISAKDDSGKLSHPFRHSAERLERMRLQEISNSGNDFLFHLQMMNKPKSSGLTAASRTWYQRCTLRQLGVGWRAITCDPAWKGTKNAGEGDFASIQVWHFERRGPLVLKFLLDGVHSNELTDAMGKNEIFRLMKKWAVRDVAVEERGGKSFQTSLLMDAATRGVDIHFIELKASQVAKPQRIATFLGDLEARRVFIVEGCNSYLEEALLIQTDDYPQVDHDDDLDAAAQTNDPAVKEGFAPEPDGAGPDDLPPWLREQLEAAQEEPLSTRHCGV